MIDQFKKALLSTAAFVLAPAVSMAQAVGSGGTGAGWLQGLVDLFMTHIATGLGIVAVMVIGLMMIAMRINLMVVVSVVLGLVILFNAPQIVSLIRSGVG